MCFTWNHESFVFTAFSFGSKAFFFDVQMTYNSVFFTWQYIYTYIYLGFGPKQWQRLFFSWKRGASKVAVVRESHKLFLSLTGEFAWKVWAVHKWKREKFHSNFPVRLKKILWEARSTPTLVSILSPFYNLFGIILIFTRISYTYWIRQFFSNLIFFADLKDFFSQI
jgi:hypothetical protein